MQIQIVNESHRVISMGVELETYSIAVPEYRICRDIQFPKQSIIEKGGEFTKDDSVGSARYQAIRFGPKAKLVWTNHWLAAAIRTEIFHCNRGIAGWELLQAICLPSRRETARY